MAKTVFQLWHRRGGSPAALILDKWEWYVDISYMPSKGFLFHPSLEQAAKTEGLGFLPFWMLFFYFLCRLHSFRNLYDNFRNVPQIDILAQRLIPAQNFLYYKEFQSGK